MAGASSAWRRNLLGCVAVAAGVALFSLGAPAIDDAIPNSTVASDRPLPFAVNASVVPPPDATVDAERTSPIQGVVTMSVEGVRYRLLAESFGGTLQELADDIRAEVRGLQGLQGIGPDVSVASAGGIPGLQAGFVGENQTGFYAVYLLDGTGVTAVVDGNDASFGEHRDEILASVRTVKIDNV